MHNVLSQSLFFNKVAGLAGFNFIEKETLVQVISCEFREIFIFSIETTYVFRRMILIFQCSNLQNTIEWLLLETVKRSVLVTKPKTLKTDFVILLISFTDVVSKVCIGESAIENMIFFCRWLIYTVKKI